MSSIRKFGFAYFLIIFSFISNGYSQISLPKIFSDNGIFQRGKEIFFYGKTTPKTKLKIKFIDNVFKTRSNSTGDWEIKLPAYEAGGPYKMFIYTKKDTLILNDILIGDIWLAGGQSNMEWFVEGAKNAEEEIDSAHYPRMRIFEVEHKMAVVPQNELKKGGWKKVNPSTIAQFSAIGFFFGRNLHEKLNIPIGIISDNWGGTVVQTWMSKDAFKGLDEYEKEITNLENVDLEKARTEGKGKFDSWLGDFYNKDKGVKNDKYIWSDPQMDFSTWKQMSLPNVWELSGDPYLVDKDGVVWFEKDIELTNEPTAAVVLSLGAIDDSDKTWVNGVLVGEMYNRYNKNRVYSIRKGILKKGKNIIVVRVEDYTGAGGFTADPANFYLEIDSEKMNLQGKWHYKVGMIPSTPLPKNIFGPNIYPTLLYNGMVNPIINFPIKGVLWYQGESNVYNAYEYRDLFRRWIKDWRRQWKDNLPILWVQLANFGIPQKEPGESLWAELREAQDMALDLDNTEMITAIDLGEGNNIHPKNKQDVAHRLSNAALSKVYGYNGLYYKGPGYIEHEINNGSIIVSFKDVGKNLIAKDKYGYVKGFTIAGRDKKFYWAKAYIIGENKVKVWSESVKKPVAVRYAWADNPEDANLYNSFGLPAFPFRTDDWKLSSQK